MLDITLTTCFFRYAQPEGRPVYPLEHYIDNQLVSAQVNLVVYGDSDYVDLFMERRTEAGLAKMTLGVPMAMKDLAVWTQRDKVEENRSIDWPDHDEFTPLTDAYLVAHAKFELVQKTIQNNPFNTTKFGWIAPKLLTKFKSTGVDLVTALMSVTDKLHVVIITAVDRRLSDKDFYGGRRYVMANGLWTLGADKSYILSALTERFVEVTDAGCSGNSNGDEMVWPPILDRYWDQIHRSYGDYQWNLRNLNQIVDYLDRIYDLCVTGYFNLGETYHRELYDVTTALIRSPSIYRHPRTYAYSLYYRYLAAWYLGFKEDAKASVITLGHLCRVNDEVANVVNDDVDFFVNNIDFAQPLFDFTPTVYNVEAKTWRSLACFSVQYRPM
jgi:hypothetical protein